MTRQEFLKLLAAAPIGIVANPQSAVRNPQSAVPNPQSAVRNPQSVVPQSPSPPVPSRSPSPPVPARYASGVTAAVVDFITRSPFDRAPERARTEAKRCLIDGFGVVLAGTTVEGSRI